MPSKSVEKPEAQDAPLNKYAFAAYRKTAPEKEPNNPSEEKLYSAIMSHIVNNIRLNKEEVNTLVDLLSSDMYKTVIKKPKVKTLYRGMKTTIQYVSKLLDKESIKKLNRTGNISIKGNFIYNPKDGESSSWSSSHASSKEFSNSYSLEDYSIMLLASTAENDLKFFDLSEIYKIGSLSEFEDEKEVMSLGQIKVNKMIIKRYKSKIEKHYSKPTKKQLEFNISEEEAKNRIEQITSYIKHGRVVYEDEDGDNYFIKVANELLNSEATDDDIINMINENPINFSSYNKFFVKVKNELSEIIPILETIDLLSMNTQEKFINFIKDVFLTRALKELVNKYKRETILTFLSNINDSYLEAYQSMLYISESEKFKEKLVGSMLNTALSRLNKADETRMLKLIVCNVIAAALNHAHALLTKDMIDLIKFSLSNSYVMSVVDVDTYKNKMEKYNKSFYDMCELCHELSADILA